MKYLPLILVLSVFAAFAQTPLPTLPAVNTLTSTNTTCVLEVLDAQVSLWVECKDNTTAEILAAGAHRPSLEGTLIGWGDIGCVYGITTPEGLNLLDCNIAGKASIRGQLLPVTRKKRWYLFWR